jgi:bacterioferritin-associated ferredoxin
MMSERSFIEAVLDQVHGAKEMMLPVLMVEAHQAPWSSAAFDTLRTHLDTLDPLMRDAAELLYRFELPFVLEEERLALEGKTLDGDIAGFELGMVEFEHRFWHEAYAAYQRDPLSVVLPTPVNHDICSTHHLSSDRVRRAIRDHDARSFEDIAPILGTGPTCGDCKLGITRLLIQEIRRGKEGVALSP